MARRRHADPRALDQAVLPLQHLACARARPRPAVRQRARPFQPAPPRAAGQPSGRSSASPATRISTISAAITNFPTAACIGAEAQSSPTRATTGRSPTATPPTRCSTACRRAGTPRATASSRRRPAACSSDGDVVDLGDRAFEVIHTPGHSPGGIASTSATTGIFLSGDIVYDGPLIDDAYHSDRRRLCRDAGDACAASPCRVVHGGHFPSFGATRYRQLIDEYCAGRRKPGCHLA